MSLDIAGLGKASEKLLEVEASLSSDFRDECTLRWRGRLVPKMNSFATDSLPPELGPLVHAQARQ